MENVIATTAQAEAELASTGRAVADAYPDGRDGVRPIVLPFTRAHDDLSDPAVVWLLRAAQLLVGALAFVVAIDLAILLYARTVTRLGEIAVRSALGAIGLAVGSLIAIAAFSAAGIGLGPGAALLVTVAAVITIVAAFAAVGRRGEASACRPSTRCAPTARASSKRGTRARGGVSFRLSATGSRPHPKDALQRYRKVGVGLA